MRPVFRSSILCPPQNVLGAPTMVAAVFDFKDRESTCGAKKYATKAFCLLEHVVLFGDCVGSSMFDITIIVFRISLPKYVVLSGNWDII